QKPAEDLHDRRFARAVFPDQRMNFARFKRQVDIMQDLDGPETLRDILQREDRHSPISIQAPSCADDALAAAMKLIPDRPAINPGTRSRSVVSPRMIAAMSLYRLAKPSR